MLSVSVSDLGWSCVVDGIVSCGLRYLVETKRYDLWSFEQSVITIKSHAYAGCEKLDIPGNWHKDFALNVKFSQIVVLSLNLDMPSIRPSISIILLILES